MAYRAASATVAAVITLLGFSANARAAFPGQNGLLAIQPVSGAGLWLTPSSGADPTRICSTCGVSGPPQWSPDGRTIADTDGPLAGGEGAPIRIIDATGTCVNCLFGEAQAPAFTPSGDLSFVAGNGHGVGVDGLDGLTAAPAFTPPSGDRAVSQAVWSVTDRLAVVARGWVWIDDEGNDGYGIGPGTSVDWSPSGARLAVARRGWVWIVDPDTGDGYRLVRGAAPAYSPDGTEVAFIGAGHHVEVIGVRGGRVRRVGTLTGLSIGWQATPTGGGDCTLPSGAELLASTAQAVFYDMSAGDDSALVGCVTSQGIPRTLSVFHVNQVAFNEGEQAVLDGGPVSANGVDLAEVTDVQPSKDVGGSTGVTVCDAATNQPTFSAENSTSCPDGWIPGFDDSDLTPSVACGIDSVVMLPNGNVAELVTSQLSSVPSSPGDWQQQVIEQAPRATEVLSTLSTSEPTGQSGITDLALDGADVTWEANGVPESAAW